MLRQQLLRCILECVRHLTHSRAYGCNLIGLEFAKRESQLHRAEACTSDAVLTALIAAFPGFSVAFFRPAARFFKSSETLS